MTYVLEIGCDKEVLPVAISISKGSVRWETTSERGTPVGKLHFELQEDAAAFKKDQTGLYLLMRYGL